MVKTLAQHKELVSLGNSVTLGELGARTWLFHQKLQVWWHRWVDGIRENYYRYWFDSMVTYHYG